MSIAWRASPTGGLTRWVVARCGRALRVDIGVDDELRGVEEAGEDDVEAVEREWWQ